jgi:hypothetical protein
MIIWGSRGQSINLGVKAHQDCKTCTQNRPFRLTLQYKYSHLYYVFRWVSEKRYFLACDICHRGWALDANKVEADLKQNPIPFGDRYGWLALIVIIAVLVLVGQFTHIA